MKPQKEWVHMNKLEPEKLEWMRDLPAPRRKGTKKVGRYFFLTKVEQKEAVNLCNSNLAF